MSRHRNVRSMNYNDEFEGYDDVYGHSVEDDYCISPSDEAQFMYDRTRQPQMSAFFNEEDDIAEEDETGEEGSEQTKARKRSESYKRPVLNDLDEAKLQSCLDEIRNVIGDSIPENVLIEIILKSDFNADKALDTALSNAASAASKPAADVPKPQRVRKERDRDDDISPEYYSLFDFFSDEDINGVRRDIENMEIGDTGKTVLLHASSSSNVDIKEKIKPLRGIFSLPKNFDERASEINDLLDVKRNMPLNKFTCKTIPECTSPSKLVHTVNASGRLFDFLDNQNNPENALGSFAQNILTKVQVESSSGGGFEHSDDKPLNPNIPRLPIKTRKDSNKENLENLSSDESDSEILLTPKDILVRQNRKLVQLKKALSAQNLLRTKELLQSSTASKSKAESHGPFETTHHGADTDKEIEFSPLVVLANQYSTLSNKESWRKNVFCPTCKDDSKDTAQAGKKLLSSEAKPSEQSLSSASIQSKDYMCEKGINFSPLPAFSSLHHHIETCPLDEDSEDEMTNVSPLLAFASQHTKTQEEDVKKNESYKPPPLSQLLRHSGTNSGASLVENKFRLPLHMGLYNEEDTSSGESEVLMLADTMSDCLNISRGGNKDVGPFSSLASLVVKHNSCSVETVSPEGKPPSSLSDLVAHHLTKSSSCWKVKADGETLNTNSVSLTDNSISKSVPGRFFIPSLGSPASESSSTPRSKLVNSAVTPSMQDDGNLPEQGEEQDDWVFDLSCALRTPGSALQHKAMEVSLVPEIIHVEIIEPPAETDTKEYFPCELDASTILKTKFSNAKKKSSSFGKILCRKWRELALPYIATRRRSIGNTIQFTFNTPSPDDMLLQHLRHRI